MKKKDFEKLKVREECVIHDIYICSKEKITRNIPMFKYKGYWFYLSKNTPLFYDELEDAFPDEEISPDKIKKELFTLLNSKDKNIDKIGWVLFHSISSIWLNINQVVETSTPKTECTGLGRNI